MKIRNKRLSFMALFMICLFTYFGASIYAAEDESLKEAKEESTEEITEEVIEDEVVESVESPVESNFTSKEYYIEGDDNNNYLVEGGNEEAVNLMATEQSTAGGTLTDNSNIEGAEYDMTIPIEEDFETKDPLEMRQFITFETKSGKEFHIIIDHGKEADNVRMLTEVSEQDLLNLIEEQAGVKIDIIEDEVVVEVDKEEPIKEGPTKEKEPQLAVDEDLTTIEDDPVNYSMIIIIVIAGITGIAGWYVKIYKPKRRAEYEDEVDEADYVEDELFNEDDE